MAFFKLCMKFEFFVKDFNLVGQKMARNGHKWPFMSHNFSVFFLQNCKKQEIVFYVIAFDPNKI